MCRCFLINFSFSTEINFERKKIKREQCRCCEEFLLQILWTFRIRFLIGWTGKLSESWRRMFVAENDLHWVLLNATGELSTKIIKFELSQILVDVIFWNPSTWSPRSKKWIGNKVSTPMVSKISVEVPKYWFFLLIAQNRSSNVLSEKYFIETFISSRLHCV